MSDEKTPNQDELMDRLVGKLEERLMGKITEHVEGQIGGVLKKNQELLQKVVDSKADNADLQGQLEQLAAKFDNAPPKRTPPPVDTRDVILSREDARNPQAYRRAKAEAEKRGVEVRIEGRNDAA